MKHTLPSVIKHTALFFLILGIISIYTLRTGQPSNERNWMTDQAILPSVVIDESRVTIDHIRDFVYTNTTDYQIRYASGTYDARDITSVWFAVEPFQGFVGAAHTFVSFGFADGRYLAISIEIRKETGESFSPWRGMLNQYELMYVIATETDLLDLRATHRKDDVFLYPINTTPDRMQSMFLSMMQRVYELEQEPEFYHTVNNNCTTNLVSHINEIVPERLPWSYTYVLPAYSDRFALKAGLIADTGDIDTLRKKYRINEKITSLDTFSEDIRSLDK